MDEDIEECIRAEYARMVAVVAITTGSETRAEDSVQEAFARAWERNRRGHGFDHLAGWVVTVALNHARSGHRRHRTEERALAQLTEVPVAPGRDATGATDLRLVVRDAIYDLAPRQRDAAILYYLLDIDVATTARLLEVSEGTVKTALSRARTPVTTTMTDLGLVVVKGTATAVWDPVADTWRRLDDAPAPAPSPEGETRPQVLDLAGDGDRAISHSANAVLDVAAGTWTPFADPPVALARATTAWTGEELIAIGGPGTPFTSATAISVDPDEGSWRTLPSPPAELRAEGLAASWDGERVVVTNYDMTAATYDPGTDTWTSLPPVPARFSEWTPLAASTDGTTVTLMAQSAAVLGDDDQWEPFPYGLLNAGPVVGLDDSGRVASWGADYEANTNTLTVTDLDALAATPGRQAGAGSVELMPGDDVTDADYNEGNGVAQTVELTIATGDGGTCTVASSYLGAVGPALDRPVREELPGPDGPITWTRNESGTTWETEATSSDKFRISCDRPADARRLAGTARFP